MILRWLLASLHLVALGLGFGAVWARGRWLRGRPDTQQLRRAFAADNVWGLAAGLWLITGLWRAFGGVEKGAAYYLDNAFFLTKMAVFVLILALEVWPMIWLIRWRIRTNRGEVVDTSRAEAFARISFLQAGLVVMMVFLAAAMARGLGTG